MAVVWSDVGLGLLIGAGVSAAYFVGLGLGMRLALRAARPVNILILSALVRIGILLAAGWAVVSLFGPWSLAGFALAFFAARTIANAIARSGLPVEGTP
ncbi:hypothetical protein A8B78_02745 [Jannaschia sp. EhC01]|nr:hypothetical protein A8B78_02745 [Jannaschia sp. EhC01]